MVWGWITRLLSGFYSVQTEQGTVVCQLRGRLKKHRSAGDIIALGDHVRIQLQNDGTGSIEEIAPRQTALVRSAPTARGVYRQVLLANPDQAVFVFACAQPEPHLRMLDRFLIVAEQQGIPPLVVANKIDLATPEVIKKFETYPPLGYPVIFTSARTGQGIDELRERLVGKLSALAGPSGVGKSSLLNAVQPELGLAVREVSQATEKGRHTTVIRQLFPLDAGGYVADLPGMRMLSLWDIQPEELDGYFPELRGLVQECLYNDCNHQNVPGCAVIEAVNRGTVSHERYESYLRLRFGEE
ncbi:MAG TPA: ribosome small subunit-dependent GTPase A [Anaerolineaceae bacterium]|nr:ribosome small subunit-dependent GTPase A [Anaerolineaceae bacterium]HBA90838.1 ribosome small subunit-dependent GTPase A [Anaerolineaceae bacterium]